MTKAIMLHQCTNTQRGCQVVDVKNLRGCIAEIRKTTTVKLWAERRAFKYHTVIKFLHGEAGKRQIGVSGEILKALREDGFLDKAA